MVESGVREQRLSVECCAQSRSPQPLVPKQNFGGVFGLDFLLPKDRGAGTKLCR